MGKAKRFFRKARPGWHWSVLITAGGAFAIAALVATLTELPELRRYLKLRSM